jgi:23S rRNA (uridine2552-2'-O)-methyltransferase
MLKFDKRFNSNWINRHVSDEFVRNSKMEGYRARSAYKLLQIIEKFPLINEAVSRPNSIFADLGAAPGSWSQVLARNSHSSAKILAIDRLKMNPLEKAIFVQQDFSLLQDDIIFNKFGIQNEYVFDIVLSDMCVELSGNAIVDNCRNSELWSLVLDFCTKHLKSNRHLLVKVFNSYEMIKFKENLGNIFSKVQVYKPRSSRSDSSETYLICLQKRQNIK